MKPQGPLDRGSTRPGREDRGSGVSTRNVILSLACFCFLFGDPVFAQQQAPQKAAGGTLTIDLTAMQKPWTGDLDGMLEAKDLELEREEI